MPPDEVAISELEVSGVTVTIQVDLGAPPDVGVELKQPFPMDNNGTHTLKIIAWGASEEQCRIALTNFKHSVIRSLGGTVADN